MVFLNVGLESAVRRRPADHIYTEDIWVSFHVDDSLICCKSLSVLTAFKKSLLCCFNGTDDGPVKQYLGCQLIRDRQHRVSTLVQPAYAERLLRTFEMWDAHPQTPLASGLHLIKADCPARDAIEPALHQRYRSIAGSIGYLVQMTRCDLAFAFSQLSGLIFFDLGSERRNILHGWVDSILLLIPMLDNQ